MKINCTVSDLPFVIYCGNVNNGICRITGKGCDVKPMEQAPEDEGEAVCEEKDTTLKRYGEAEEEVAWEKIKEAETRLKPCPFCKSKALINYVPPHTHGGAASFMPDCKGEHFIECTGCSCAIAGGPDLEETIAIWNKRAYSWDLLMEILDEVYPADVFNGSSGDVGPRIVMNLREIDLLRQEAKEAGL